MNASSENLYVSCRVGDLLVGIALSQVQEINRMVDVTAVPCLAPDVVGLINLRGALVTVLDLRRIVHGDQCQRTELQRNVITRVGDETIGFLVDRIGDVVDVAGRDLEPLPRHLDEQHGRWFRGLFQLEHGILLALDVSAASGAKTTAGTEA